MPLVLSSPLILRGFRAFSICWKIHPESLTVEPKLDTIIVVGYVVFSQSYFAHINNPFNIAIMCINGILAGILLGYQCTLEIMRLFNCYIDEYLPLLLHLTPILSPFTIFRRITAQKRSNSPNPIQTASHFTHSVQSGCRNPNWRKCS